jgi:GNAT superfamily N-acetyltransferase
MHERVTMTGSRIRAAQVAAEAMPYITHRRPECNTGRPHPAARRERLIVRSRERIAGPGTSLGRTRSWALAAEPCEVGPVGVEYLVRMARVTDIDRIVALGDDAVPMDRGESPLGVADLMRQLVYLPQASIVVAEAQRAVVGGAILALRPSVRAGGFVGTIDLLVVDPEYDVDRITEALLEELLRSASNKGCTVVEAARPDDGAVLERWQRMGFDEASPHLSKTVAAAGSVTRRTI